MHMDVGGHVAEGGWWLAQCCDPWEYLSCGHGRIVHARTVPQYELLCLHPVCSQGCGCLTGAFSEQTMVACSYRGELFGLMAIHLILLSLNRITPDFTGSAHIFSDCLGALDKIRNLPSHHIPLKCPHSDVIKKWMLHCASGSTWGATQVCSGLWGKKGTFKPLS